MVKKLTVKLCDDGSVEILGIDSLTTEEKKLLLEEIRRSLELINYEEEEPHEF